MSENKKNSPVSIKYIGYDFFRFSAAPGLLWFRPKRYYLTEKAKQKIKGGALIICNHVSLFDPMYLMLGIWRRRHRFVAATELFGTKFTRWLFSKGFLCIEIDRENFSLKTLKEVVNILKGGEVVSMFPEGHVNVEKSCVQSFKSGMVLMALKSECPIIPVYIKRRKHFYSRVELGIGEPINIKDFITGEKMTVDDIKRATEFLQEQEKQLEELVEGAKK